MNTFYHLVEKSDNRKTGPIPVITVSRNSCPPDCAFYKKCYGEFGGVRWNWDKISLGLRGGDLDTLCAKIKTLPDNQLFRYGIAGDAPGKGKAINGKDLNKLVEASKGKRGFLYTHKYNLKSNHQKIKSANENGLAVNLSANNLAHADKLAALNIGPVVAVVPEKTEKNFYTPGKLKGIVCPAQLKEGVNCLSCRLCQNTKRTVIIGFRVHGNNKKKIEEISNNFKV